MNKPFTFIKTLSAVSILLAASAANANQQIWPQTENAYQNKQQSPQWIESQQAPTSAPANNYRPNAQVAPQAYPGYNQQYAPNYYAPRPYNYYPNQYRPRNNNWGNMPFFGGNRGGWPNGNWGNWSMPDMDMSMPDMNMPNMSNMPFSNMPSPSFDLPSPSFTTPNMPMPFWN